MKKYTGIKYRMAGLAAIWLGLQALAVPASGENTPAAADAAGQPVIFYKPPLRGAPQTRVGGGTRGSGEQAVLQVLAPDHVGLTTRAQPTLYWYARTPAAARFEVALIDAEGIDPLLETDTAAGKAAGFQQLNLGDYGVSLQPGVSYQWSVAVVADADNRSTDLVASGVIEMIEPGKDLSSRVKGSSGIERAQVYASEGIWYDALEEISTLIAASPGDESLQAMRSELLAQAGLEAAIEQ